MEMGSDSNEFLGDVSQPTPEIVSPEGNTPAVHPQEDLPVRLSSEKAADRERVIADTTARFRTARMLGRSGLTLAEMRALKLIRGGKMSEHKKI